MVPRQPQRRVAGLALLAAVSLAAAVFPFRTTSWGALLLAVAEAAIVGGLADWFAVTALFRRPLGLPIPHTALIPNNWELMARRVGAMVGNSILTKDYVREEIEQVDLSSLLERVAAHIAIDDLQRLTTLVVQRLADHVSADRPLDVLTLVRRLASASPPASTLAMALDVAREQGWDERAMTLVARASAGALDSPAVRLSVEKAIDEALTRYQKSLSPTARLLSHLGDALGMLDREQLVNTLHDGLRELSSDVQHPIRAQLMRGLHRWPARLRTESDLQTRVDLVMTQMLESAPIAKICDAIANQWRLILVDDLRAPDSECVRWLVGRLDHARVALVSDEFLRRDIDRWAKRWALQMLNTYHDHVAAFVEKGVRTLGPEGAVNLIEEHAGNDLQYIRVNGTLVGGLAGGALYGLHLLLQRVGL